MVKAVEFTAEQEWKKSRNPYRNNYILIFRNLMLHSV